MDYEQAKRLKGSRDPRLLARRTEMVSVRLAPGLRYAAEIAARSQRRTVSSLIEVAVAAYLRSLEVAVPGAENDGRPVKLMKLMDALWDPDEADRFVKLAENHRWLLENEEEHRWKAIQEHFGAKGRLLTPKEGEELRLVYDGIKKKVAENLRDKELAKFANR